MSIRRRTAVSAVVLLAMLLGLAGVAAAAPPPYEPDSGATGVLSFYDSSGNVITTGSVSAAPFAAYVGSSVAGRASDYKATLFGYLPNPALAPGS